MPEKIPTQEQILPEAECKQIAEELYARYEDAIVENRERSGRAGYNKEIEKSLEQFPPEVLHKYWGHGVTKGQLVDHLAAAISILANRALRGSWAPLANSGYVDAYTDRSSFVVLSHKNERLEERHPNGQPVFTSLGQNQYTGEEIRAVKANFGAFVVNDYFEPLIQELRSRFPDAPILSAGELADYIKAEESKQ